MSSGLEHLHSILNWRAPPYSEQEKSIAYAQEHLQTTFHSDPSFLAKFVGKASIAPAADDALEVSCQVFRQTINAGRYPFSKHSDIGDDDAREPITFTPEQHQSLQALDHPSTNRRYDSRPPRSLRPVLQDLWLLGITPLFSLLQDFPKLAQFPSWMFRLEVHSTDQGSLDSSLTATLNSRSAPGKHVLAGMPRVLDKKFAADLRAVREHLVGRVSLDPARETHLRDAEFFPAHLKESGYLTYDRVEFGMDVSGLVLEPYALGLLVAEDLKHLGECGYHLNGEGHAPRPGNALPRSYSDLSPAQRELLGVISRVVRQSVHYGAEFLFITDSITDIVLQLPMRAGWETDTDVESEIKWVVRPEGMSTRMFILWAFYRGCECVAKMGREFEELLREAQRAEASSQG